MSSFFPRLCKTLAIFLAIFAFSQQPAATVSAAQQTEQTIVAQAQIVASRSGGSFGGRSSGGSFGSRSGGSSGSSFGSRSGGGGGDFGSFFFFLPFFSGGGGGFAFIFIIALLFLVPYILRRISSSSKGWQKGVMNLGSSYSDQYSAIKVQVMMSDGEQIKTEIRRIAERGNPNTSQGLAEMFREACLVVLRNQDRWSFGTTSLARGSEDACAQKVSSWASEARSAFSIETTTNRDDLRHRDDYQARQGGTYLIVTLAVAARNMNLPKIEGAIDQIEVKDAVTAASGVSGYDLIAAEVVWAPDAPAELLTQDEALSRYPSLYKL